METNGNELAFPCFAVGQYEEGGLTKREFFAGMAMAGMCANPSIQGENIDFAETARSLAEALIAALSNPDGGA